MGVHSTHYWKNNIHANTAARTHTNTKTVYTRTYTYTHTYTSTHHTHTLSQNPNKILKHFFFFTLAFRLSITVLFLHSPFSSFPNHHLHFYFLLLAIPGSHLFFPPTCLVFSSPQTLYQHLSYFFSSVLLYSLPFPSRLSSFSQSLSYHFFSIPFSPPLFLLLHLLSRPFSFPLPYISSYSSSSFLSPPHLLFLFLSPMPPAPPPPPALSPLPSFSFSPHPRSCKIFSLSCWSTSLDPRSVGL